MAAGRELLRCLEGIGQPEDEAVDGLQVCPGDTRDGYESVQGEDGADGVEGCLRGAEVDFDA